jgi:UDP-N-acetylglucosamine 2-epimerase
MKDNQTLAMITERALVGIDEVLENKRPDFVIVQGDTTTLS